MCFCRIFSFHVPSTKENKYKYLTYAKKSGQISKKYKNKIEINKKHKQTLTTQMHTRTHTTFIRTYSYLHFASLRFVFYSFIYLRYFVVAVVIVSWSLQSSYSNKKRVVYCCFCFYCTFHISCSLNIQGKLCVSECSCWEATLKTTTKYMIKVYEQCLLLILFKNLANDWRFCKCITYLLLYTQIHMYCICAFICGG